MEWMKRIEKNEKELLESSSLPSLQAGVDSSSLCLSSSALGSEAISGSFAGGEISSAVVLSPVCFST
jgi:hypothetical protein